MECGDLLLGLSYLPTAQRLSFSLVKVNHIKQELSKQEETLNPYLRLIMFNQSGRLVKKKKTTVKVDTKDPVFNETLNFEVAPEQLKYFRFLVILFNKRQQVHVSVMEDSTEMVQQNSSDQEGTGYGGFNLGSDRHGRHESHGKLKDVCIGRIVLGVNVTGEKEKEHYRSVCDNPRQVVTMWHRLK